MATANINAVITADDKASAVIKKTGGNIADTAKKIGLAMTVAGAGLTLLTKNAVDFTKGLVSSTKELQRQTGLSSKEASGLLYVTSRLGLETEQTTQIFGIFSKKIAETTQNSDKSATALGRLGVSVKNADGSTRAFNEILLDTADRFVKLPAGAQKTALAMELFGKAGKDMIPILNLGSKGIKDLEEQADKLGLTLSTSNINSFTKYTKAQRDLKDSTNALKIQIGLLTAPVLANLTKRVNDVIRVTTQAKGPFKNLAAGAIAAGGPILTLSGGALAFAANFKTAGLSIAAVVANFARFTAVGAAVATVVGTLVLGAKLIYDKWRSVNGMVETVDNSEHTLNETLEEQATTLDDVKNATHGLHDARLDLMGSTLGVERSQRDYNEAVKEYGPKSLEAREAAYQLKVSKERLRDAQKQVAASQELANQKEREFKLQTPGAVSAIQVRVDKFGLLVENIKSATSQAIKLDTKISGISIKKIKTVGQMIQGTNLKVEGLQGNINTVQKTGGNLFGPSPQLQGMGTKQNISIGHNAEGTNYWKGGPTWVGEKGPEVVDLPQGSRVTPNGSGNTINLNVNVGMYAGSEMEKRKIAKALYQSLQDAMGPSFRMAQ